MHILYHIFLSSINRQTNYTSNDEWLLKQMVAWNIRRVICVAFSISTCFWWYFDSGCKSTTSCSVSLVLDINHIPFYFPWKQTLMNSGNYFSIRFLLMKDVHHKTVAFHSLSIKLSLISNWGTCHTIFWLFCFSFHETLVPYF